MTSRYQRAARFMTACHLATVYTEGKIGRSRCTCGACGAPRLVAFTGKRQYLELMNIGRTGKAKLKNVQLGRQTAFPEARRQGQHLSLVACLARVARCAGDRNMGMGRKLYIVEVRVQHDE